MSTFEKQIFMPRGALGPLILPEQHLQRVNRWYKKDWENFAAEVVAYKSRVHNAARDAVLWHRENCVVCKKVSALKKRQRGSILLSAFGISPGTGLCSFTSSTIPNLSDIDFGGSVQTRARLHSDGDWYSNSGSGSWGSSDGTWQGSCSVASYDTRWNRVSGSTSNDSTSGSDGVWSAATTSKAVGYFTFAARFGSFSMECRDGATSTLLFTDTFTMDAENIGK